MPSYVTWLTNCRTWGDDKKLLDEDDGTDARWSRKFDLLNGRNGVLFGEERRWKRLDEDDIFEKDDEFCGVDALNMLL